MAGIDHNKVLEQLRSIKDPDTGHDLISANRLADFTVRDNKVGFTLKTHGWEPKTRQQVNFECQAKIGEVYPDAQVHIHMETQRDPSAQQSALPHVKNVIAIASGKGGVGKSTVAVHLALGLKKLGARVGLIDADLYGPSIPIMLGLEGQRPKVQKVYGKPKIIPVEKDGLHVVSIGFIVDPEQAVVLRGPRLSGVIKQFVHECIWPELDYLIVDLPPGTGDIQLTLVQTLPVTGAIMVTTPQKLAHADALKAMNMFLMPNIKVPIIGIVENMSWFTPDELPDNKYYLFGKGGGKELAKKANSVLLGQIPIKMSVMESADRGTSPYLEDEKSEVSKVFDDIARKAATQIAIRNETMDPTRQVEVDG